MKKLEQEFLHLLQSISPLIVLASMILTFAISFVITYHYYYEFAFSNIFTVDWQGRGVAFITAMTLQVSRLAFGLASADEFSSRKYIRGAIGLVMSCALAVFAVYEAVHLSEFYQSRISGESISLQHLFVCVVLLGLALEIRLVVNLVDL